MSLRWIKNLSAKNKALSPIRGDRSRGERKNFFSREKKFFPSPRTPLLFSRKAVYFVWVLNIADPCREQSLNQKCSRCQQKLLPLVQNNHTEQPGQPQNKQKRQQIFAAFIDPVENYHVKRYVHIFPKKFSGYVTLHPNFTKHNHAAINDAAANKPYMPAQIWTFF